MNDKTIQTLSRDERSSEMGKKIWDIAQKLIGWALVAGLVFLIDDRNRAWDAIDRHTHDIEFHEEKAHSLLDRDLLDVNRESQARHLLQDKDLEQLVKDMDELGDRISNLELQIQRMWIELAKVTKGKLTP